VIVIAEERLSRSELIRRLPPDLREDRLSLLSHSRAGWVADVEQGSPFVHHVRLEGIPLMDREGVLEAVFCGMYPTLLVATVAAGIVFAW